MDIRPLHAVLARHLEPLGMAPALHEDGRCTRTGWVVFRPVDQDQAAIGWLDAQEDAALAAPQRQRQLEAARARFLADPEIAGALRQAREQGLEVQVQVAVARSAQQALAAWEELTRIQGALAPLGFTTQLTVHGSDTVQLDLAHLPIDATSEVA